MNRWPFVDGTSLFFFFLNIKCALRHCGVLDLFSQWTWEAVPYYYSGTYKLVWTRKVKELDHSKVIACDYIKAWVGDTGTGDVCFVCVPRPDADHLVPEDAGHSDGRRESTQQFPCTQWIKKCSNYCFSSDLVQVAQVILSMWDCSVTCFPDGTSYTSRL